MDRLKIWEVAGLLFAFLLLALMLALVLAQGVDAQEEADLTVLSLPNVTAEKGAKPAPCHHGVRTTWSSPLARPAGKEE